MTNELRDRIARVLFEWNTPGDPYFVIKGRDGEHHDGDPYAPIAQAVIDALGLTIRTFQGFHTTQRYVTSSWHEAGPPCSCVKCEARR